MVAMAAVIVGVDFVFFRNRFWERLIVNIGIVLVFAAFYLRFLKRPWTGAIAPFRRDCADAFRTRYRARISADWWRLTRARRQSRSAWAASLFAIGQASRSLLMSLRGRGALARPDGGAQKRASRRSRAAKSARMSKLCGDRALDDAAPIEDVMRDGAPALPH